MDDMLLDDFDQLQLRTFSKLISSKAPNLLNVSMTYLNCIEFMQGNNLLVKSRKILHDAITFEGFSG